MAAVRAAVPRLASLLVTCLLAALPAGPADAYSMVVDNGHDGLVQALALSPDGRLLASAGHDRSIRLWSMEGRLVRVLRGHAGPVRAVAFHPSGALIASVGDDNTLRLWDPDGTELWSRPTESHGAAWPADAVVFGPESVWFSTGGWAVPVSLNGDKGSPVLIAGTAGDVPVQTPAVRAADGSVWFATSRGAFSPTTGVSLPVLPEAFAGSVSAIANRSADNAWLAGSSWGCVALLAADAGTHASDWQLLQPCDEPPESYLPSSGRIASVLFAGEAGMPLALRAGGETLAWETAGQLPTRDLIDLGMDLSAAIALGAGDGLAVAVGAEVIAATADGRARLFGGSRTHYTSVDIGIDDLVIALGTFEGRLELWRRDGSLLMAIDAHEAPIRNVLWHRNGFVVSQTSSEIALWRVDGRLLGRMEQLSLGAAPLRWDSEAPATLWASGAVTSGRSLLDGRLIAGETAGDFAEQTRAIHLPGDGSALGLGEDGRLRVRDANGDLQALGPGDPGQDLPAPMSTLRAAIGIRDGGWAALDAAGRLIRWTTDGAPAWTRASYGSANFRAGRFTAAQLESWCRTQNSITATGSSAVGVATAEAGTEASMRRCMDDPRHRGWLRELPAEGVFEPEVWRQANTMTVPFLFWNPSRPLVEDPGGERIATGSWDGTVTVWSADGAILHRHQHHDGQVLALDWSDDGRHLLSVAGDAAAVLLDTESGSVLQLTSDGRDWVTWAPDGRFTASRGGGRMVSVASRSAAHAVDQFAPVLNDPAAVLEPLGLIGGDRAAHFRAARERRYARLGDRAEPDPAALPTAEFLAVTRDGDRARIRARLAAGNRPLAAWQLWADDVPLHGIEGAPVTAESGVVEVSAEVDLLHGENRIELSAIDVDGSESVRAASTILHQRDERPALWFAGFGVSDYRLDWLPRLNFAAKDATDLEQAFGTLADRFSAVHLRTWVDDEVDLDAFDEAHAFLEDAAPEDLVVLFIAGHGTYEQTDVATFRYLLPESQRDDLAGTAIAFERAEAVLHGLASRRKLFLMDTCESGELTGDNELARYEAAVAAGIVPRVVPRMAPRTVPQRAASDAPEQPARHWLRQRDRFIYADLARRSGAVVFSAAMGHEASNEAIYLRNGFFTQGVLSALADPVHDFDGDGVLSIEELFDAVQGFVQQESTLDEEEGPTQNPVIDRDNLSVDLRLPLIPADQRGQFAREL